MDFIPGPGLLHHLPRKGKRHTVQSCSPALHQHLSETGRRSLGAAGPLPEAREAQAKWTDSGVSQWWFFPACLVPFPQTRQKQNHPRTVILTLLRPNTFVMKSQPAALYDMHLLRLRISQWAEGYLFWLSLSLLLKVSLN